MFISMANGQIPMSVHHGVMMKDKNDIVFTVTENNIAQLIVFLL